MTTGLDTVVACTRCGVHQGRSPSAPKDAWLTCVQCRKPFDSSGALVPQADIVEVLKIREAKLAFSPRDWTNALVVAVVAFVLASAYAYHSEEAGFFAFYLLYGVASLIVTVVARNVWRDDTEVSLTAVGTFVAIGFVRVITAVPRGIHGAGGILFMMVIGSLLHFAHARQARRRRFGGRGFWGGNDFFDGGGGGSGGSGSDAGGGGSDFGGGGGDSGGGGGFDGGGGGSSF